MAPPPTRASAHAVHHTRPAQAPPVEWSDPPATWAAVTSRRLRHGAHIPTDDSYLGVRVSSLRYHNWDFLPAPRNAIFVLPTTTHNALEDVGCSKASLRFALDLALQAPSPLSTDVVSDTIELCDLVRTIYSARYSSPGFRKILKRPAKAAPVTAESDSTRPPTTAPSKRVARATVTNPRAQREEQAHHGGAHHGQRHGTGLPRDIGSGKPTTKASNTTRLSRPQPPRFRTVIPPPDRSDPGNRPK